MNCCRVYSGWNWSYFTNLHVYEVLSHCVPLLSHTGWWRTWRMKLQTTLSSWATGQNKSCPGYPWYPAVGFFDSSGSVLGDLSYLTKSHQHETKTQNGIYPRPSGQTVGLHYFFIGSSKSCSTIMPGWTKSKQHIQHTQTHTSLQICTSKKKTSSKMGGVSPTSHFPTFSTIFSLHKKRPTLTLIRFSMIRERIWPNITFRHPESQAFFKVFFLSGHIGSFPGSWTQAKNSPVWKSYFFVFWRKEDLFWNPVRNEKKSSWKFCFLKSCMRS